MDDVLDPTGDIQGFELQAPLLPARKRCQW